MPGATLLRALRARGPMPEAECRAVLRNARDKMGPEAAAACRRSNKVVALRVEHALFEALPASVDSLTRAQRVLYTEQAHRLGIKRRPDGVLMRATELNSVCKESLARALIARTAGVPIATVVADYPAAHADLIALCREGRAMVAGDRAWALQWPAAVPGAAEAWMAALP